MKIKTLGDGRKKLAHVILLGSCLIGTHIICMPILYFLRSAFHIVPGTNAGTIFGILTIIGWIILPLLVFAILLFKGYEEKIYLYLVKKDEQKKLLLEKKVEQAKIDLKNAQIEYKENGYIIESVLAAKDQPTAFVIKFNATIYREALPVVRINELVVPIEVLDKNSALCFAGNAITSEDAELTFATGKNTCVVTNPYFMDMKKEVAIKWQNEGHSHQKKILIPKDLLPNANQYIVYTFQMYLDGKTHTAIDGRYDPSVDCIIFPLGSKIFKDQCKNKKCSLRALFGKGNQITLPAPIILS